MPRLYSVSTSSDCFDSDIVYLLQYARRSTNCFAEIIFCSFSLKI